MDTFWATLKPHAGKILGTLLGLVLGWTIIRYGVIRGAFITLCLAVGYYLGSRWDANEDISDLVDRLLR